MSGNQPIDPPPADASFPTIGDYTVVPGPGEEGYIEPDPTEQEPAESEDPTDVDEGPDPEDDVTELDGDPEADPDDPDGETDPDDPEE